MVPSIANRVARNSTFDPVHINVVPGVPFMTAGNTALMSPNERLAIEKLIDIEFQGLGDFQVGAVEVDVIRKIMEVGDRLFIGQVFGELHIPENIGERQGTADIEPHGATTAQCWGLDSLLSRPGR